jgi:hypothetical protein
MVTFKWGKVYVEDTALGLPIREVMLHNGIPDSTFTSHDAMRDSIFATEWFNWPVSAEINYDRLLVIPAAGYFENTVDTTIDTNVFYDTVHVDTAVTFDTIPADTLPYYYAVYDSTVVYDTFYDSALYSNVIDTSTSISVTSIDSTMIDHSSYIDTSFVYDTTRTGLTTVYDTIRDTVPGSFTIDSTDRTDSSFIAPGVHMKYTVQLIHQNGHIDTVEQMTYNPYDSANITPMTVHIANAGYAADTVMLRVIGDFAGIPDADSDVEFDRETMLDVYPTYGDTTFAIGTGGGIVPPTDSCWHVVGPFPNPTEISSDNVSILVHYCVSGNTITAQVYNVLGVPVGSAVTYLSDGQVWDRLDIPTPSTPGPYYIHVGASVYSSSVLMYSVY